jgi:hypothetical protein
MMRRVQEFIADAQRAGDDQEIPAADLERRFAEGTSAMPPGGHEFFQQTDRGRRPWRPARMRGETDAAGQRHGPGSPSTSRIE